LPIENFLLLNTTGKRVRALRKKLGITQAELARRIGFVRHYISLVENGREPSPRFIRAIELVEQAPKQPFEHSGTVQEEPFASDHGLSTHTIPLLSWAQAGAPQAWTDVYSHEGFIGFNVRDSRAVAVQIRGDAMAPQYPHGTFAIVYPSSEAKTGDLVIAVLNDGTVMFRRLHVDGTHYTFISLNPLYPPLTVEKSKVSKLLPVGGTFQGHL
jgi:SOS-response transcriptional repressor LexA